MLDAGLTVGAERPGVRVPPGQRGGTATIKEL